MKFKYNGQWIEIPTGGGGTSVIPNPSYTPEDESFLETIKIGNDIFKIPIRVYWELPSTDDFDEGDIIFGLNNTSASGNELITAYQCTNDTSGYVWEKINYGANDILVNIDEHTSVSLSTFLSGLGTASELDAVPFNDDSPFFFEASSVSVDKNGILSDAQTEFERIDEDISDLQTDSGALEQEISELETRITNLLQQFNSLKTGITSKGSATKPVYFDSNGVAQPTTYNVNNVAALSYTVQSTWT